MKTDEFRGLKGVIYTRGSDFKDFDGQQKKVEQCRTVAAEYGIELPFNDYLGSFGQNAGMKKNYGGSRFRQLVAHIVSGKLNPDLIICDSLKSTDPYIDELPDTLTPILHIPFLFLEGPTGQRNERTNFGEIDDLSTFIKDFFAPDPYWVKFCDKILSLDKEEWGKWTTISTDSDLSSKDLLNMIEKHYSKKEDI